MISFISQKEFWTIIHLFAMVLGLGGATYSDLLLFRFLKDLKISPYEAGIIKLMAKVILFGLFLAFVSGIMLYLPEAERLSSSSKFQAKVIMFIILMANGMALHVFILPKLVRFSFHKDHFMYKKIIQLRHVCFSMGAISVISWYSIFILGSLRSIPYGAHHILVVYFMLLIIAVSCSLGLEHFISKNKKLFK